MREGKASHHVAELHNHAEERGVPCMCHLSGEHLRRPDGLYRRKSEYVGDMERHGTAQLRFYLKF